MLLCGMQVVRAELVEALVAAAAEAAVETVRLFGCWRGQKVSPGGLVAWGFEFSLEVVLLHLCQCPHRARLPRGEHLVQVGTARTSQALKSLMETLLVL
jgi:hypothetical protein